MSQSSVEIQNRHRAVTAYWFILGFASALLILLLSQQLTDTGVEIRANSSSSSSSSEYRFINPLLACEIGDRLSKNYLRNFKSIVQSYTDDAQQSSPTLHISVYYRDLNNGPWFGINEEEKFYPASLLKMPTLIAALKKAETDHSFLEKKIIFGGSELHSIQIYPPRERLVENQVYSVKELLERMIRFSDNDAATLVAKLLGGDAHKTYTDIGIALPPEGGDDFMNVKEYSTFFRVLFNAGYLSKPSSELALALLSSTDFTDGLRAGVPDTVPIAHKFGERSAQIGEKSYAQLHDCGIVYIPEHPYILCIMTRSSKFDELASHITEISRIVYRELTKNTP